MPTGGFSTKNASVAHFDSVYIDLVITFFMVLAGINFSLHYQLLRGKTLAFWRDSECRFFLATVLVLTLVVGLSISRARSMPQSARRCATARSRWSPSSPPPAMPPPIMNSGPPCPRLILLLCMFLGASAGSTGGGMKCLRIMLCFKYCYKELFSLIHPRAVTHVKIAGKAVPEDVLRSVLGFLALYMGLFGLCSVLLAGLGVDLITAFGAVAATIGNIGPGFGMVGPVDNFAQIPALGKWLLIWCMLLGRLEIYTLIILFVPEFWRK